MSNNMSKVGFTRAAEYCMVIFLDISNPVLAVYTLKL